MAKATATYGKRPGLAPGLGIEPFERAASADSARHGPIAVDALLSRARLLVAVMKRDASHTRKAFSPKIISSTSRVPARRESRGRVNTPTRELPQVLHKPSSNSKSSFFAVAIRFFDF